ncbi:MAG: tRNA 5-methoxyuridine(34)/uridine 5-oxyacetic acid(34) synthase CmoB [Leptospiraceae bacterium]|nr:tRNA 5-methoxyuridine(34)/uridine 5-oxyacetic acid(34) synthase CmoB [Leptospiraceae bacterium]MDW8306313.1 tRNA 5-methoxyuridine(34)/uridine 5-oxyacetic acid(34) synthase CmoB [Leptospiraceae bacterium]
MKGTCDFFASHEERARQKEQRTGFALKYSSLLKELPPIVVLRKEYDRVIRLIAQERTEPNALEKLEQILKSLSPWRKGPFELFGIRIDSEWQSFYKWERIAPFLPNLEGRLVLDIGCGNGYYLFRLLEKKPAYLIGVDPSLLYYAQFQVVNFYAKEVISFWPLSWEELEGLRVADVVLCMGLLYHEENPFALLRKIHSLLKNKGVAIIESLTLDIKGPFCLFPGKSYCNVGGVYHIPSPEALYEWLKKTGFSRIEKTSHTPLTMEEQRPTIWAKAKPLSDFLVANGQTKEGYPPPWRTVFFAYK